MATDSSFAAFVLDQAGPRLRARAGKMFGEYALYVDEKVVAFLCDNRVLLKPTDAGRPFFEAIEVGHPYPGAKDYWVADEVLEEAPRFQDLLRATANALPAPIKKKPKAPKAASEAPWPQAKRSGAPQSERSDAAHANRETTVAASEAARREAAEPPAASAATMIGRRRSGFWQSRTEATAQA